MKRLLICTRFLWGRVKYSEIYSDRCVTLKYAKNLLLYTLSFGGMNYGNKH